MVPITVVTGFLGAGKTSLIAHLLDNAQGRRIAVVVNELAAHSIDAAYLHGGEHIASTSDTLIRTVSGGRAGAGKTTAVVQELGELVGLDPPPEAIVVETSGSSPALALVAALEHTPTLQGKAYVDSVISVVDATGITRYWKDQQLRPLLEDQLTAADLIILNKADRVGYWNRRRSVRLVRRVNKNAQVGTAEYGRLPIDEVLATKRHQASDGSLTAGTRKGKDATPRFQPVTARHLVEPRPFHPERLDAWLNSDWPGIIRVKGFAWLATDMDHVYVVDAAGDQREVGLEGTWYAAVPPEERPDTAEVQAIMKAGPWGDRRQAIVVIGAPEAVERELRNVRACLLSGTELDRGPHGWRNLPDPLSGRFENALEPADTESDTDPSTPPIDATVGTDSDPTP